MALKIDYATKAKTDLADIMDYIEVDLHNLKASKDFYSAFTEKKLLLKENPYMYEIIDDKDFEYANLRKMPIDNYVMIYNVDEYKKAIKVLRFFYQKQDYIKHIS